MDIETRSRLAAAGAFLAILMGSPARLAAQPVQAPAGDSMVLTRGFRGNSAVLLPAAKAALDSIARAIRAEPGTMWEVAGYTSSAGAAARNLQLSRKRAEAVEAYLVGEGVPASHLRAVGYGARHPVASNGTAAGRSLNMRVEIRRRRPSARQATRTAPTAAAPTAASASAPEGRLNVSRQDSTAGLAQDRPVASAHGHVAPAPLAPAAVAPRTDAGVARAPAAAARAAPEARDRGGFGLSLGYAAYNTSYWFYGGGNSRYQAWHQVQASGYYEGRTPLRVGAWRMRYRIEARIGTGGADDNAGSGYVGNGASLTNGSLSAGLAATLRLPLAVSTGTHPIPYVGLGADYSFLWGFGDNSGSIYGKGWNERILTVPLVVGVAFRTASLTISPEIRYGFLGSSSSNLYLSGAGYAMQDNGPVMQGLFVSISWR